MNESLPPAAYLPSQSKTLRRLFLTLFLRGRSARGMRKETAPKSVGHKLALTLLFYVLFGLFALFFFRQPVFSLAVYLHGMTFVFLGMFVASSAGEILFNRDEADILLHRPVDARQLLWAKIRVMVEVSLWLGFSFNLAGLFIGLAAADGGWLFPIAHLVSTTFEALFCAGCVVMVYQLCLRWFGRERLDALMTTAQVVLSITMVVGGQILPRMMGQVGSKFHLSPETWWMALLPPAWFAGFDDLATGHYSKDSLLLAGMGIVSTGIVLWLAFVKLARDYQAGLQTILESAPKRKARRVKGRRFIDVLVGAPPLSWWLRTPVSRAGFLLAAAYLVRDRETKLRIYPGIAPMMVMPLIFLLQERGRGGGMDGFGVAITGSYLGIVPMLGMNLLQYSQQWQAADLFRSAPMPGPAELCHGARRAVLLFLTLPVLLVSAALAWAMTRDPSRLVLMIPGILALPVYALIPCVGGKAVPLSLPTEEAKSAGRGLSMMLVMFISMALGGVAIWMSHLGYLWWFVLVEALVVAGIYAAMRASLNRVRWSPLD